jgi:single-strand DNA-binding protein
MSFEITGTLHKKFETEKKTESFSAREFVIEIQDGNYPQVIKFQLVQDRCALLDDYTEGEPIKVHFDLRGREWSGKYFTNLNAWRLEKVADSMSPASPPAHEEAPFPTTADEPQSMEDDLPF